MPGAVRYFSACSAVRSVERRASGSALDVRRTIRVSLTQRFPTVNSIACNAQCDVQGSRLSHVGVVSRLRNAASTGDELFRAQRPHNLELTEIARWHLDKWSSGRSRFDRNRAERRVRAREPDRTSSISIAELSAIDNPDGAGLSIHSPTARLHPTTDEWYRTG